jgi:TetR/AcrR family transcriptional repressor of bet genes
MGMVQHYFTTKDQMLRFAVEMMAEDVRQRIRQRVGELAQPIPRLLVRTVLTEMIPDPGRNPAEAEGARLWVRRFLLTPESREALHEEFTYLKGFLTEQILLARASGTTAERASAERDAEGLIALVDGLIYNIVTDNLTAHTATAVLHSHLDHVFGSDLTPP